MDMDQTAQSGLIHANFLLLRFTAMAF